MTNSPQPNEGSLPWGLPMAAATPHQSTPTDGFLLGFLHLEVARWMTLSTWKQRFVETPLGHITSLKFRRQTAEVQQPSGGLVGIHLKQTKKTLKVGERRNGYVIQNTNFSWGSKKKTHPSKINKTSPENQGLVQM